MKVVTSYMGIVIPHIVQVGKVISAQEYGQNGFYVFLNNGKEMFINTDSPAEAAIKRKELLELISEWHNASINNAQTFRKVENDRDSRDEDSTT